MNNRKQPGTNSIQDLGQSFTIPREIHPACHVRGLFSGVQSLPATAYDVMFTHAQIKRYWRPRQRVTVFIMHGTASAVNKTAPSRDAPGYVSLETAGHKTKWEEWPSFAILALAQWNYICFPVIWRCLDKFRYNVLSAHYRLSTKGACSAIHRISLDLHKR